MIRTVLIAGAALLTLSCAQAEEVVLFDAAKQCQVRQTTQGTRYVPPCRVPQTSINLSGDKPLPAGLNGLDTSTGVAYTFECQSLRPFSIRYQINSHGVKVKNGYFVPVPSGKSGFISASGLQGDSQLLLNELIGVKGFQAFKPGCVLKGQLSRKLDSKSMSIAQRVLVVKANVAKTLSEYSHTSYENKLTQASELLKTVTGFVVLTTQPQLGQSLFDLANKVNSQRLSCMQGKCDSQAAVEFGTLFKLYRQQLVEIRNYLQSELEALEAKDDEHVVEYRNLLIYLNIELYKL